MDELNKLAERCEAATEPSGELDVRISYALVVADWEMDDPRWKTYDWPAYTASLDAAMTLVPEGWGKVCRDDDDRGAFARVYSPDFDSMTFGKGGDWITETVAGQEAKAYAATWPLALCAAALRAQAQRSEG